MLPAMRRLAQAECPAPPMMYVLDGNWWVGCFGTVVAIDQGVLAVRMDDRSKWPEDVLHLLLPIADRMTNAGIKGDGVVVGRLDDILICRYFPNPNGSKEKPALGDEAWVDHSTSLAMRASWRSGDR